MGFYATTKRLSWNTATHCSTGNSALIGFNYSRRSSTVLLQSSEESTNQSDRAWNYRLWFWSWQILCKCRNVTSYLTLENKSLVKRDFPSSTKKEKGTIKISLVLVILVLCELTGLSDSNCTSWNKRMEISNTCRGAANRINYRIKISNQRRHEYWTVTPYWVGALLKHSTFRIWAAGFCLRCWMAFEAHI